MELPARVPVSKMILSRRAESSNGRQHRLGVFKQRRMPVVRIAPEEAVEIFKAQATSPLVEGPGQTLLPIRNQVVLAEPGCVVAVADEDIADNTAAPASRGRNDSSPR
jgi:hypothetical protein